MITITPSIAIDEAELTFTVARSSGPGGQNVNKVNSRVTLLFDVAHSTAFDEEQRAQILERLATRISKAGVLRVTAQAARSQAANREAALERFVELLREAVHRDPQRFATRIPAQQKRKRIEDKKRRSLIKRERRGDW